MRSFLHVDARQLDFRKGPDGKHRAKIRLMAYSFGDNGIPADSTDITAILEVPDEKFESILKTGYVYGFSFPVKKPGAYQMPWRSAMRVTANWVLLTSLSKHPISRKRRSRSPASCLKT